VWLPNLLFNLVEYISSRCRIPLRLFGNMYAGEIIFLLLWMMGGRGSPARSSPSRRPGVADLPYPDRRAAGVHFHDAHHRLHRGWRTKAMIN